eukprot:scaffold10943_cov102-Isochrysis_galbana.AAC.6
MSRSEHFVYTADSPWCLHALPCNPHNNCLPYTSIHCASPCTPPTTTTISGPNHCPLAAVVPPYSLLLCTARPCPGAPSLAPVSAHLSRS